MQVQNVAIIGAGVSGVVAAKTLASSGLTVTVFERASSVGGIWSYSESQAPEPQYPSIHPSKADFVPAEDREGSTDGSHIAIQGLDSLQELELKHAPPGPAYKGLMNNIPTSLLGLKGSPWKEGTADYVKHEIILEYIRNYAKENNIDEFIRYNTRVEHVSKKGTKWEVKASTLVKLGVDNGRLVYRVEHFDAVVVASGHYHAAKIPDLPGLQEWKLRWPDRISHSLSYRDPEPFRNQNVLLIGAGVSSTDIANEVGTVATKIYQVARSSPYDIPAQFLPGNAERVPTIASFNTQPLKSEQPHCAQAQLRDEDPLPGTVHLSDSRVLENIHRIVLATGYHITYPFLPELHEDNTPLEKADQKVLVTDGTQVHNLHKDIFWIPDETLSFVGTAYSASSFSLFEFQALAVAAVYSGRAKMPSAQDMREEYRLKILEKGLGRKFHTLKDGEVSYINSIVDWINRDGASIGCAPIEGHSEQWISKNAERREWVKKIFAAGQSTVEVA